MIIRIAFHTLGYHQLLVHDAAQGLHTILVQRFRPLAFTGNFFDSGGVLVGGFFGCCVVYVQGYSDITPPSGACGFLWCVLVVVLLVFPRSFLHSLVVSHSCVVGFIFLWALFLDDSEDVAKY